jgi:hypothetical protein
MEQQEETLRCMRRASGDETTSLQFPWAMGALADDKGVTFMYITAAPSMATGKRICVEMQLCWDKLDAIFACIAVLRVRGASTHTCD